MKGKPKKSISNQIIDSQYQITQFFNTEDINSIEESGENSNDLIFCPICLQDLHLLTYNQRNSHVNSCMDKDLIEISTVEGDISTSSKETLSIEGNFTTESGDTLLVEGDFSSSSTDTLLVEDDLSTTSREISRKVGISTEKREIEQFDEIEEIQEIKAVIISTNSATPAPSTAKTTKRKPETNLTNKRFKRKITTKSKSSQMAVVSEEKTSSSSDQKPSSSSSRPSAQSKPPITASKSSTPPPKNIPFYKILEFDKNKKIAVDAFCYGAIEGISAYFLTHFHSDHYGGLRKSWSNGVIYCSEATARLVRLRLNVHEDWIRPLPMNQIVDIDGLEVLLLDANHCPGSAIILFRYKNHSILHTGDFRACQKQIDLLNTLHPSKLDIIYLDTTYLHPKHCIPSQDSVINACTKYCTKLRDRNGEPPSTMLTIEGFMSLVGLKPRSQIKAKPIVFVGSYVIGKERLAVSIAKQLGSKIFPSGPDKAQVLRALEDPELNELLIDDGLNCNVHLVSMRELDSERLVNHWKALKSRFTHLIVFSPTGWNFYASKAQIEKSEPAPFGLRQLENSRTILENGKIHILRVPYSEHSSFPELRQFVQGVPAKRVIPTVNNEHLENRRRMGELIGRWSNGMVGGRGGGSDGRGGANGGGDLIDDARSEVFNRKERVNEISDTAEEKEDGESGESGGV